MLRLPPASPAMHRLSDADTSSVTAYRRATFPSRGRLSRHPAHSDFAPAHARPAAHLLTGCLSSRGARGGQGPPRMKSGIAAWRCGKKRIFPPPLPVWRSLPTAVGAIPHFQSSMHLHNLSSIFSLSKKASQRALRCTGVLHRTSATAQPAAAPHRTAPEAAAAPAFHNLSTEFSTFSPVFHSDFLSPWLSLRETA